MTQYLPPAMLRLFIPRPPLDHLSPIDREPGSMHRFTLSGVGQLLPLLEPPLNDTESYTPLPFIKELKEQRVRTRLCFF